MNINYRHIAKAVKFYKKCGFEYIDAPWIVSREAVMATCPPGASLFTTFKGELVASGEQSFIEMRAQLEPGKKYQCVTPCFRNDKVDELHNTWFLKNELIWVADPEKDLKCAENRERQTYLMRYAEMFFSRFYPMKRDIRPVHVDNAYDNYDIFVNDIEVGSYGIRSFDGFTWVYGTGCAEPRLSQALKALK